MKRKYVLTCKNSFDSAKKLAEELGATIIIRDPERSNYKYNQEDFIVNWGRSELPEHVHAVDVNCPSGVSNTVDKEKSWSLAEKLGIKTPDTVIENLEKAIQEGYVKKVIYRSTLQGMDGEGIRVERCHQMPIPLPEEKMVPLVDGDEYRVHVAFGKVVSVNKRFKKHKTGNQWEDDIKTTKNGWRLLNVPLGKKKELEKMALLLAEECGTDTAAYDFIEPYFRVLPTFFLEANSGPQLGPKTTKLYAKAIKEYYEEHYGKWE